MSYVHRYEFWSPGDGRNILAQSIDAVLVVTPRKVFDGRDLGGQLPDLVFNLKRRPIHDLSAKSESKASNGQCSKAAAYDQRKCEDLITTSERRVDGEPNGQRDEDRRAFSNNG